MNRVVVIIQARMGSTRLPGKVLKDINGKPMLWHVIDRVMKSKKTDLIVVATTTKEEEYPILEISRDTGIEVFCGNEWDVLDRYYKAAVKFSADIIVRVTSDCPLVDPNIIDNFIDYYFTNTDYDYLGVGKHSLCPNGVGCEVFSFEALKMAWTESKWFSEREHVTPYIWKNDKIFNIGRPLKPKKDLSKLRWTVDEKRDLKFVREVYKELYNENNFFSTRDVLELLKKKPELNMINNDIIRNEGYIKSLKEDRIIK
jgi:spore coat polysaccharide biosynthesis protein SpsF (cytidylyltransferase family)